MDTVDLFNKKENIIKKVDLNNAVSEIYYLRYRVPTTNELIKHIEKSRNEWERDI